MSYESESFREHHLTRLPVLEALVSLGWAPVESATPAARQRGQGVARA